MSASKTKKIESPTSFKGMRDILEPEYFAYQGFFEKASEIALYYGFKPIELPILEKEELFTECIGEGTDILDKEMYSLKTKGGHHLAMRPEGTAGVVRAYIEHGMNAWPQPVMLYYYGSFFRHENSEHGKLREFRQFGVEILGTSKSIADALVVKVMYAILEEAGFKNLVVHINSIGDKESQHTRSKELVNFYKKNMEIICADCRQRIKTNPMRLLDCKNEKCQELKKSAPDSVSSLSPGSKKHFKEVLEYLDAMSVIYEIDNNLVRGLDYYSETVFEIVNILGKTEVEEAAKEKEAFAKDEKAKAKEKALLASMQPEKVIAEDDESGECKDVGRNEMSESSLPLAIVGGGRYDNLAKMLGFKKELPCVGASIGVDRVIKSTAHKPIESRLNKKPKIYFIQLGFEAKLKSLTIIEMLRKARIPIKQSLAKDRISAQLLVAERLKVPYTIILGQREALDNTVIIRNMETRSQETIKIADLMNYIKKEI